MAGCASEFMIQSDAAFGVHEFEDLGNWLFCFEISKKVENLLDVTFREVEMRHRGARLGNRGVFQKRANELRVFALKDTG